MSSFNFSEIKELKNFSVEVDNKQTLILARKNFLYEVDKSNLVIKKKLGKFKLPFLKSKLIKFKLFQRLLRCFFYNVLPLDNGDIFVTFAKSIGVIKQNGDFFQLEGLDRPFRVLRNAVARNTDGLIYFGEYSSNKNRDIMRVYQYKPGSKCVEVAHVFKAGSIRHIHGIYYDKYSKSLWCVTGDDNHECSFIQTFDGFKTIKQIGHGDETWRAVSLIFTKDYIYYAMDAEFRQNKIYRLSRKNLTRTSLGNIDGPVYYSIMKDEKCYFQVTAELCPSQTDKHASIWEVDNDGIKKIWTKKKDIYPQLLMPGTVNFPIGEGSPNEFYFHCVGVSGCANKTFKFKSI